MIPPLHEWNHMDTAAVLGYAPHGYNMADHPVLKIAVSLAAADGLYSLDELRPLLPEPELPESLTTVLKHLLDSPGVYDLTDLRRTLKALPSLDNFDWDEENDENVPDLTQPGSPVDSETEQAMKMLDRRAS